MANLWVWTESEIQNDTKTQRMSEQFWKINHFVGARFGFIFPLASPKRYNSYGHFVCLCVFNYLIWYSISFGCFGFFSIFPSTLQRQLCPIRKYTLLIPWIWSCESNHFGSVGDFYFIKIQFDEQRFLVRAKSRAFWCNLPQRNSVWVCVCVHDSCHRHHGQFKWRLFAIFYSFISANSLAKTTKYTIKLNLLCGYLHPIQLRTMEISTQHIPPVNVRVGWHFLVDSLLFSSPIFFFLIFYKTI